MGKEDEDDNFKPNGTILKRTVLIVGGKTEIINYEIGQNLRKGGGGGTCYLCRDAQTKEIFVVKEFPIDYLPEKERNLHQNLDHKNIVKIKDNFIENKKLYLLLEYCQNSDLSSLLKKRIKLKEIEVQYYIINLIEAVKYLHEKRIVHRDIKPSNIFLTDKLEVKLGDFGLSKEVSENEIMRDKYGTHGYMAPEIYENKGYLFEVDIWAIGVIIYQLILGKMPFYGEDKDMELKIKNVNYGFPKDAIISNAAKDLIKQILVKDPKKRPSLDQMLEHDFFKLGSSIPKLLPVIFKDEEPSISYIKNFMPDADDNGIVNRSFISKNITDIRIEEDIKQELKIRERFQTHVKKYYKKSTYIKKYGFAYMLNNNNIGVCFKDSSKIIYNPRTNKFFYGQKGEKMKRYNMGDNSYSKNHDLNKKLKILRIYMKKIGNYSSSDNLTNNLLKEEESEEFQDIPIYVEEYYLNNEKPIMFKLSNKNFQVQFLDETYILISNKSKEILFTKKSRDKLKTYILEKRDILATPEYEIKKKIEQVSYLFTKIINGDKY